MRFVDSKDSNSPFCLTLSIMYPCGRLLRNNEMLSMLSNRRDESSGSDRDQRPAQDDQPHGADARADDIFDHDWHLAKSAAMASPSAAGHNDDTNSGARADARP